MYTMRKLTAWPPHEEESFGRGYEKLLFSSV